MFLSLYYVVDQFWTENILYELLIVILKRLCKLTLLDVYREVNCSVFSLFSISKLTFLSMQIWTLSSNLCHLLKVRLSKRKPANIFCTLSTQVNTLFLALVKYWPLFFEAIATFCIHHSLTHRYTQTHALTHTIPLCQFQISVYGLTIVSLRPIKPHSTRESKSPAYVLESNRNDKKKQETSIVHFQIDTGTHANAKAA